MDAIQTKEMRQQRDCYRDNLLRDANIWDERGKPDKAFDCRELANLWDELSLAWKLDEVPGNGKMPKSPSKNGKPH